MTTTPATAADATTNPSLSPLSLRVRAMFFAPETPRPVSRSTSFNRVKAAKFRQQTNDHMITLRLSSQPVGRN
jgi:hypothetical protein